jgi:hypothetical protein
MMGEEEADMDRETAKRAITLGERHGDEIAKVLGLKRDKVSVSYGDSLNIKIVLLDPSAKSAEAVELEKYGDVYGVGGVLPGTKFRVMNEEYTIDGINYKAKKFPFLVTRLSDGKRLKAAQSWAMFIKGGAQ